MREPLQRHSHAYYWTGLPPTPETPEKKKMQVKSIREKKKEDERILTREVVSSCPQYSYP